MCGALLLCGSCVCFAMLKNTKCSAFLSCLQFAVLNSLYCNVIFKSKQIICLEDSIGLCQGFPKVGRGFLWRGSLEQTWVEWVAAFVLDRGPSERILTKTILFLTLFSLLLKFKSYLDLCCTRSKDRI